MSKYLDNTGLTYFWDKLKAIFVKKSDLSNTISNDSTKALTPKAVYDAGYLTSYTETDPTVPSWAKQSTKPTYTASEVGALPDSTTYVSSFNGDTGAITYTAPVTSVNGQTGTVNISIPSNVSDLTNDSGFLTSASTLDATKLSGTVPTASLPSYVDDVLEYTVKANFPATGETGKIYVDKTTNLTWRWSGSAYVEISPSLALGTTSSTAFRGDYGDAAYAHAVTNKGSAFSSGLYKITTNSEGHVTAANAVEKSDITGLGIPGSAGDVNQNAFSNVKVGSTTIAADSTTDTLELVAGSNVTLTPDATNDKVTIAATIPTETDPVFSASVAAGITSTDISNWNNKASTDENVTQTAIGYVDASYELLLSGTADNTTRTEGVNKTSNLTYNPIKRTLEDNGFFKCKGISSHIPNDNYDTYITQQYSSIELKVDHTDENWPPFIKIDRDSVGIGFSNNRIFEIIEDSDNDTISTTLTNLVTPTNSTDAVNKAYVDNKFSSVVLGVKGDAEYSYRRGSVNITPDNIGAIQNYSNGNTLKLSRPLQLNGIHDVTIDSKINDLRANRLAFLPADQIIIEKTIDGGTTWTDAGISDANKLALFSEQRPDIALPLLNGVKDIKCGLRITITAMKYNVPDGTVETNKYNYWNSNYIKSTERYNQLKEMYFWVSSNSDSIYVKVERATGSNSTNWSTIFENTSFGLTGWSGCNYIKFNNAPGTFGGGTNQTGNFWNYRLTFFTRGPDGSTTLSGTNTTSAQTIQEIRGYGDTWWVKGNQYAASDHLYSFDANQNATFPAKITATSFVGNLTGTASGNLTASSTLDATKLSGLIPTACLPIYDGSVT